MREGKYRLAVVQSHVIEYFGPFFHDLARHPAVELVVYYGSRQGAEADATDFRQLNRTEFMNLRGG